MPSINVAVTIVPRPTASFLPATLCHGAMDNVTAKQESRQHDFLQKTIS